MKQLIFLIAIILLTSCKKTSVAPDHSMQFQSNTSSGHYTLTINGTAQTDLTKTYTLATNSIIDWKLFMSGGDTVNVNGRDTLRVTGTIYVDGKAAKAGTGYSDIELIYTIK